MNQRVLIIGGTRNLGPGLVRGLLDQGCAVTLLNRGVTPDDLPAGIERLRADRGDRGQFARALAGREFDAVVDMVLFNGAQAASAVEVLRGRVGHYLFISSGQVYLVREGARPPFREADYDGSCGAMPGNRFDLDNWRYGMEKRAAEDTLARAWMDERFPFTSLRIPMVNSERDHHYRIHGYLRRMADGGPILVTKEPARRLRHIYGADVSAALVAIIRSGAGKGRAYNLAQDESLTLDDFLARLAAAAGMPAPRCVAIARDVLLGAGIFPRCSPFSDPWMSEMDAASAMEELNIRFTPVDTYLPRLAAALRKAGDPPGYEQRHVELELAQESARVRL